MKSIVKQYCNMRKVTVSAMLALLCFNSYAENETCVEARCRVPVYKRNGVPQSGIDHWYTTNVQATVVTSKTGAFTDGWYVVNDNIKMLGGSTCDGRVHLILCDGKKLTISNLSDTGESCIRVQKGNSITIYGQEENTGKLSVGGDEGQAGIGGGGSSGEITINGGEIFAIGGSGSAGIGGGSTIYTPGDGIGITINGGKVTAYGGMGASGIGGGSSGSGIDITINGGSVIATGTNQGAGIGGGSSGIASNLFVNAGNIIASGGGCGSGVGSGDPFPKSVGIFVSNKLKLMADNSTPPSTTVEHQTDQDLSDVLKGKRYATIVQPEWVSVIVTNISGATWQVYHKGCPVDSNEVPSNAVVRVVYTANDGKSFAGGSYVWQCDCHATNSVQFAPFPTETLDWNESWAMASVAIDTRENKRYFNPLDILPIWSECGATVQSVRQGSSATEVVADKSVVANTIPWRPDSCGEYHFTHDIGGLQGCIIYALPVELNTNGLDIANTSYALYADGAEVAADDTGKLIVAKGSIITTRYEILNDGEYFENGARNAIGGPVVANDTITYLSKTAARVSMAIGRPKVQLGVVAQRYPWNGVVDIQYRALFWPGDGYFGLVEISTDDASDDFYLDLNRDKGTIIGTTNYNTSALLPDTKCNLKIKARVISADLD